MVLILLLAIANVGQITDMPPARLAAIRRSLNRFDDLDKIALDARAKAFALREKDRPHKVLAAALIIDLKRFAAESLNIPKPYLDAEINAIETLAEAYAKLHDLPDPPEDPVRQTQPARNWYSTIYGWKWGWIDPATGQVGFYPHEQPQSSLPRTPSACVV